jgi:hypothetical protein
LLFASHDGNSLTNLKIILFKISHVLAVIASLAQLGKAIYFTNKDIFLFKIQMASFLAMTTVFKTIGK